MIWDCFTYRNEEEILEIRLHELAPYVDYFVLVEGALTFQSDPKPYLFEEVKERFAAFPIIHVKMPGIDQGNPWANEAFQRNGILRGLEDAEMDDVCLIGDVDEIPRGEGIAEAVQLLEQGNKQVGFSQTLCFYHANAVCTLSRWDGTQAARVSYANEVGPEQIRRQRIVGDAIVPNGGCHWCNFGDPEWLIAKIESFSHTEVNLPQYKDPEMLARCISEHKEMTGRRDLDFKVVDPSEVWMPEYLLANRERFSHFFAELPVGVK